MQRAETSFCFPESIFKSVLTFLSSSVPMYKMHNHVVIRSPKESFADLQECFNGQSHFPLPPKVIKGWNKEDNQPGTQRQGNKCMSSVDQQYKRNRLRDSNMTWQKPAASFGKETLSCEALSITCHWELAHNPQEQLKGLPVKRRWEPLCPQALYPQLSNRFLSYPGSLTCSHADPSISLGNYSVGR